LVACGILGPVLFVLIFLAEGIIRPGYDPLQYPISSLSIGERGWVQVCSFILTGCLLGSFSFGLYRSQLFAKPNRSVPWLMALVSIGLAGAGVFSTDAVYGYPSDQPYRNAEWSTHGHLHEYFSIPVFVCIPILCFIARRYFIKKGEQHWATYSAFSGVAMFTTFIITGFAFRHFLGLGEFVGTIRRICVIIGFSWIALFARKTMRMMDVASPDR
jgi:hypothetical membrane protein